MSRVGRSGWVVDPRQKMGGKGWGHRAAARRLTFGEIRGLEMWGFGTKVRRGRRQRAWSSGMAGAVLGYS